MQDDLQTALKDDKVELPTDIADQARNCMEFLGTIARQKSDDERMEVELAASEEEFTLLSVTLAGAGLVESLTGLRPER